MDPVARDEDGYHRDPENEIHKGWVEEEREKAREGRERALTASRELLTTLLEDRFGPLPDEVRTHTLAADANTLNSWMRKVVRAPDLKSIFS